MGIYTEYLDRQMDFATLTAERKGQLKRISSLRGRDVLVFAADLGKTGAPISIQYSDVLPIKDQLSNLKATKLDLILETPGGSGEVAEDIVRLLRTKHDDVAIIVPGWAKSAGTIIAMSGDDILMEAASALGPIDAQLQWQGKQFSADALLEGFEKIKREVTQTGALNKAYIPILQAISPGELQSAENALLFAERLVTDWLIHYKFKTWEKHKSTGADVTDQEKQEAAAEIARQLRNHGRWLTHGRSLKIADLKALGLRITDYSGEPELSDAVTRYHTLLQMTFATNIYKVFETPTSQVYRFMTPQAAQPLPQLPQAPPDADAALVEIKCSQCGASHKIQANLGASQPIQAGHVPFPANNRLRCSQCGVEHDLSDARRQVEASTKKKIVS